MNRQHRRKTEHGNRQPPTLDDGIRAMHAECGGALIVQVIRPPEALALVAQACSGDAQADAVLDAFMQVLRRVEAAPKHEPALCVACSRPPVGNAFNVAVAIPMRDVPGHALGFIVCEPCGITTAAIRGHAIAACREIWPDLRQVTVTHGEGGRA